MDEGNHKGGPGPWFCALYFNLADSKGTKKQTDLRVHTYPLLFERVMNGPKAASVGSQGWVIIMMVGHFERWEDAVAYHTLWASQTRGKFRRIQRGLDLFHEYAEQYKLRLWAQPLKRNEAIKAWTQAYNEDDKKLASSSSSSTKGSKNAEDANELATLFAQKSLLLNTIYHTQQQRKKQK